MGWPDDRDRATLAFMNQASQRALLVRPLALGVGALAAVGLSEALRSGLLVAWNVAIFGGFGLVCWLVRDVRFASRFVLLASPVSSLLGWGTLALFTRGLESPFLAAFFLEVALSAVAMGPRGVLWVTANAIGVLGLIELLFGFADGWPLLLLEGGFLVAIGGIAAIVAARRESGERALRTQGDELGARLETLQRQLEDERVIARVGENVARLAHGLKNAVHSLRGFVGLLEPQLDGSAGARAALVGLRTAIDELEKLARLTLAEREATSAPPATASAPAARPSVGRAPGTATPVLESVEAARCEIVRSAPAVEWMLEVRPVGAEGHVSLPAATLLELLIILMRNAVEAMRGEGRGRLEVEIDESLARCRIAVLDEGEGLESEALSQVFQPGYTTKPKGSGFGLFLARRIVEDHGGSLELASRADKGAVARLELPLVSAEGAGD